MKINIVELEEYNNLIDNIVSDIEAGKTVANPLKNQLKKSAKEIIVESTATEKGEEEMQLEQQEEVIETAETEELQPTSEYVKLELTEGNVLLVEDTPHGYHIVEVYENAVKAAKANSVHPTTIRKYAASRKPINDKILLIYYNPGEKYV